MYGIASQMLEATLKGYTGQFVAFYIHASGIEIQVDMAVDSVGPSQMPDTLSDTGRRYRS